MPVHIKNQTILTEQKRCKQRRADDVIHKGERMKGYWDKGWTYDMTNQLSKIMKNCYVKQRDIKYY